MYIILDIAFRDGHCVMNCSLSVPTNPSWGGWVIFPASRQSCYLDGSQLPLVVLSHWEDGVVSDGGPHPSPEVLDQPEANLKRRS